MATVPDLLARLTDNATVRRVYGEPYERDGVRIIPAAEVRAGGGLGLRPASREQGGEDAGGGVGLTARPVGAYVIRDGRVSWQPAFDLSRVAVRGQLLAVAGLLTLRWLVKTFRRPRRRASRR
jgi:uncharacterized spore protein YtfJ